VERASPACKPSSVIQCCSRLHCWRRHTAAVLGRVINGNNSSTAISTGRMKHSPCAFQATSGAVLRQKAVFLKKFAHTPCRAVCMMHPLSQKRNEERELPETIREARHAASGKTVNLIVMAPKDAPHLDSLKTLPACFRIVGIGCTVAELSNLECKWESVDVMLVYALWLAFVNDIKAVFSKASNLKWLHVATTGVDHLMAPEIVDSDVIITNAQGSFSHSLAEWTLAACNWFAKDLPRMRASQKMKKFDPFEVEELRGRVMGIVGLGDIGCAAARLARAFKMGVVGMRRNARLSAEEQQEGLVDKIYPPEEICSMMSACDYVVVALPMTSRTDKLVSKAAIQAMKPNGVLVNVGRGKTVDEQALIEALQNKAIRGAALDVFEKEPLPEDSPLYDLDNVLLSAHSAFKTRTFRRDALQSFLDAAERYASGQALRHVVDKDAGY
ncbi:unnamed protein product, partial [Ostreobium quekettii]